MTDLEQQKLEAEIANLNAETARAVAEARKVDQERASLRRSWRDWSLEAVKLVSAVILGAGGITAAITGYQMSELRKEKVELETAHIRDELTKLIQEKAATESAVKEAQMQLASMKSEVEGLQTTLEAARKKDRLGGFSGVALDDAISRAAGIGNAVSSTTASLKSATEPAQRSGGPGDYLVGLQTLGLTDSARVALNAELQKAGYRMHAMSSSFQGAEPPSWFAQRSTVLYYAAASMAAAKDLARALTQLTGDDFTVQRGSGLGVDPSERDVTLFVHYLKK